MTATRPPTPQPEESDHEVVGNVKRQGPIVGLLQGYGLQIAHARQAHDKGAYGEEDGHRNLAQNYAQAIEAIGEAIEAWVEENHQPLTPAEEKIFDALDAADRLLQAGPS